MELIGDSIIIISSQLLFFLCGWIFFVKMLFKDYELHHRAVQLIFCVNFCLSCTMFEVERAPDSPPAPYSPLACTI